MTVKKHRQAQHRAAAAAATLPLLLLIITSLTVPLMLFSAPLAAARTAAEDCEASGGTWVQRGDNGFCFRTLEPIVCTLPPIPEVPDPPLECRGGVIVDPDNDEDFSAEILDFAFDVADVDRDGTQDGNGGGDGNQDDANVQQQDSTQGRTQGDNNVNENTQVDVQRQSEQIVTDDGGGTDGGSGRD